MKNTDIRKIRRAMEKSLTEKRYEHTLGVAYTAAALAMRYGASSPVFCMTVPRAWKKKRAFPFVKSIILASRMWNAESRSFSMQRLAAFWQ